MSKPLSLRAARLQIERYPNEPHNRKAGSAARKRAIRTRTGRRIWVYLLRLQRERENDWRVDHRRRSVA